MIATRAELAIDDPSIYWTIRGRFFIKSSGIRFNPMAKDIDIIKIYWPLLSRFMFLTIPIPARAIIPLVTKNTPPIAADGMTVMIADNFPEKPIRMRMTPTKVIMCLLKTLDRARTPTFEE